MYRIAALLIGAVFLAGSIAYRIGGSTQVTPSPHLVVDRTIDLGDRLTATHISHDFTIRNNGTLPVRITGIRPECGCVSAGATASVLSAGEESIIKVTISLDDLEGQHVKRVMINTDSPSDPQIMLAVRFNAVPHALAKPGVAEFGRVLMGSEKTLEIQFVARNGAAPPMIANATSNTGAVRAEIVRSSTGRLDKVRLHLNGILPPQEISGELTINLARERHPPMHVPISALIVEEP